MTDLPVVKFNEGFIEPSRIEMLGMLESLFGASVGELSDGLIELAWSTRTLDGQWKLSRAQLYRIDELSALVDHAAKQNNQGNNVYVGAQLRHKDTAPFARARDTDALGLTSAYVDIDEEGAAANARTIWGRLIPTLLVITGRDPDTRAQVWWRLNQPSRDQARNIRLLKAMAVAFNGDTTVTNPSRIMRLCGSVAHPKKDGRVIELTERYHFQEPGPDAYTIEELEAAFLPATLELIAAPIEVPVTALVPTAPHLGIGKLKDGREKYMRDTVLAGLVQHVGENGAWPTAPELFDLVWPQYERNVDLTRSGRGEIEVREKCAVAIRRAVSGELPKLETLDKVVEAFRNRSTRPEIFVIAGQLPRVVDEAEAAIINGGFEYFQRGSLIVRPITVFVITAHGGTVAAQQLAPANASHLAEVITRAASLKRYDARVGDWVAMDCTLRISETLLARSGHWRLPVLTAMINTPTLRADGTVLDQPGYDTETGLLFDPQGVVFQTIPDNPSKADAEGALSVLLSLIDTFPFVGKADRAVALSAILTTIIRRSIPTAPLHAFNAPVAGSGKSMLVDIVSMIASGRRAAVIAQGKTEEEMEKRLGAALIAGDQLISIDNCEAPLGGELLCQALTQSTLKVRILGKSINAEVPTNAAMFATGNNLTLTGDIIRRAVRCSLDPGMERPELREFGRDPIAEVETNRGKYVLAATTILRAFSVAGRPQQTIPLGSFPEWSGWVRDSLIWLGIADPCATMEDVRSADPQQEARLSVVQQWHSVLGDKRVSVKQVIDAAVEQKAGFYPHEFVRPDFREALLAVAGDRGAINGRRLGKWLAANQNRVVGEMKFISDGVVTGIARWRLTSSSDPAGTSGH